jgi:anti-anti-sigma factor
VDRTEQRRRVHPDWDLGGDEDSEGLLDFAVEATAGETVLRVSGEVDLASAPALASRISAHSKNRLTLDLRQVSFMDCQGLAVLRSAAARARTTGHRLTILSCPALRRLVTLFGMQDMLDIAPDR